MKVVIFLALVAIVACKSTKSANPRLDGYWELFKKTFGKSYDAQEENYRRLIWGKNVGDILRHNFEAKLGLHSFTKGLNKYSDMSLKERRAKLNGFIHPTNVTRRLSVWLPPMNYELPEQVDWREQGLVTPVKDQLVCGSCWAFSATGALEGQHKRKTGQLMSLSEQNLVDCSRAEGTGGCHGGWMDQAFEYIKINRGIDTEESYPYTGLDGKCHYKESTKGATCSGFVDIPSGDEEALKIAVATIGPISVAICASEDFYDYKDGIYETDECDKTVDALNHAVLIIGYGTENGKDYWLLKNCWSSSWGKGGYMKMVRNKDNHCGIATKASFPLV
ncbi:procathepsin L-like [Argiope bruennichi]|uniref:procathepsin L-like n=1 Tax=Argiope bruennichi TaxID=94029 RepID=UPI002495012F|nr:procathepsin L-like [Argiope bruennichi]